MSDPGTTALEALGHVRVANTRCTARYKAVENPAPGPKGIPIWCALPAGHEGPHRHVHGHHSSIMGRDHLIEMVPLPDLCQKCGTRWPCKDAQAVINAFTPPCDENAQLLQLNPYCGKPISVIPPEISATHA